MATTRVSLIAIAAALTIFLTARVSASDAFYELPPGIDTRWFSPENPAGAPGSGGKENAGRKGAAYVPLGAGQSHVMAHSEGRSGVVRRIWMTLHDRSPDMLRGIRLDMYWDNAQKPAVSVPVGDFFGHGAGKMVKFESELFSSPEGRSFNCVVPMPFRDSMKIILTNETERQQPRVYFDIDCTFGEQPADNMLYFHASFRRENPTTLKRDFEIVPKLAGAGRYMGAQLSVRVNMEDYGAAWWGEGEVKIYLDGDTDNPTLAGTGAEDYIGTGYNLGVYSQRFQGCPYADPKKGLFSFYRLHVPDPVYFRKNLRVTIQQIGNLPPRAVEHLRQRGKPVYRAGPGLEVFDLREGASADLMERQDDWSACSYFYLDKPQSDLPAIPPVEERTAHLDTQP